MINCEEMVVAEWLWTKHKKDFRVVVAVTAQELPNKMSMLLCAPMNGLATKWEVYK
jgi:hypothetical protein